MRCGSIRKSNFKFMSAVWGWVLQFSNCCAIAAPCHPCVASKVMCNKFIGAKFTIKQFLYHSILAWVAPPESICHGKLWDPASECKVLWVYSFEKTLYGRCQVNPPLKFSLIGLVASPRQGTFLELGEIIEFEIYAASSCTFSLMIAPPWHWDGFFTICSRGWIHHHLIRWDHLLVFQC